jgi:hypothetical protein
LTRASKINVSLGQGEKPKVNFLFTIVISECKIKEAQTKYSAAKVLPIT